MARTLVVNTAAKRDIREPGNSHWIVAILGYKEGSDATLLRLRDLPDEEFEGMLREAIRTRAFSNFGTYPGQRNNYRVKLMCPRRSKLAIAQKVLQEVFKQCTFI